MVAAENGFKQLQIVYLAI